VFLLPSPRAREFERESMSKISFGKVLAGGILAGVIMTGLDLASDNFLLAADWQNVARLHDIDLAAMGGTSALVLRIVLDFVLGQFVVLTYAAIRPRFGPGPGTAAIAALFLFVPEVIMLATLAGVVISWDLFFRQSAVTLVAMLAGGLAGGWVYAEPEGEDAA
jgi:hypothetical protein